jgi:hypothetical protein
LHHDVTAQLIFQVKSAEEPRDRGAEPTTGAAEEPKKRRFFRRQKEEKKETK